MTNDEPGCGGVYLEGMLDSGMIADGIANDCAACCCHDCGNDAKAGSIFSFVGQLFDWARLWFSLVTLDVLNALLGHMAKH